MPHIEFPLDVPGILGVLSVKPATSATLAAFLESVLRGAGPLTLAERELIAAQVSAVNNCEFCARTHAATAARLDPAITGGPLPAPQRLPALLAIADAVAAGGHQVTAAHVADARAAGLDDEAIHDAVLIASMMCMLNRYIDGLGADRVPDDSTYDQIGTWAASDGYSGLGTPAAG